jgi:hypothetical protein
MTNTIRNTERKLQDEITRAITRHGVESLTEAGEIREYLIRWSGGDLEAALTWAQNPVKRGGVWTW